MSKNLNRKYNLFRKIGHLGMQGNMSHTDDLKDLSNWNKLDNFYLWHTGLDTEFSKQCYEFHTPTEHPRQNTGKNCLKLVGKFPFKIILKKCSWRFLLLFLNNAIQHCHRFYPWWSLDQQNMWETLKVGSTCNCSTAYSPGRHAAPTNYADHFPGSHTSPSRTHQKPTITPSDLPLLDTFPGNPNRPNQNP